MKTRSGEITVTITFGPDEIPKGFRLTGEYRCPKRGEWVLDFLNKAVFIGDDILWFRYFILEKLPRKKRNSSVASSLRKSAVAFGEMMKGKKRKGRGKR